MPNVTITGFENIIVPKLQAQSISLDRIEASETFFDTSIKLWIHLTDEEVQALQHKLNITLEEN